MLFGMFVHIFIPFICMCVFLSFYCVHHFAVYFVYRCIYVLYFFYVGAPYVYALVLFCMCLHVFVGVHVLCFLYVYVHAFYVNFFIMCVTCVLCLLLVIVTEERNEERCCEVGDGERI